MSTTARIRDLIRTGETSNVEFKSSFRFDYREKKVNKELCKVIAKTIAGFMNSDGGTLFIGVGDNGEILGIENDIATLSRKTVDGFELSLRTSIGTFLGGEKSALVDVNIHSIDRRLIAEAVCKRYPEPVILVDGDKYEFYIRDGNLTRPLNSQEQHNYTKHHWPEDNRTTPEKMIREVVKEVLSQQHQGPALGERREERGVPGWKDRILNFFRQSVTGSRPTPGVDTGTEIGRETGRLESLPSWLTVRTRNVLDAYLYALKQSGDWKRLNIISPWLSPLDDSYSLTSDGLAQRLKNDGATLYLVTRSPVEPWHTKAIETFASTGRANVAFIDDLHAKLFTASTATSSFALVGSANFTQNSIENMEIGLLAHSYMEGKKVVTALDREAVDIYRTPGRKLIYRAHF